MEVTLIYNILSLHQVPGTVLSALLYLTLLLLTTTTQVGTVINSSLQMETLRHREAKKLHQGHTASNPAELGFRLGSVYPRGKNLNHWPTLPPRSNLTCLLK